MKKPVKRNEKTNTGEGGKGKRGRTDSDDVGGKSLSDTSTSARGQCVGESSTGVTSTTNFSSINLVSTLGVPVTRGTQCMCHVRRVDPRPSQIWILFFHHTDTHT